MVRGAAQRKRGSARYLATVPVVGGRAEGGGAGRVFGTARELET